MKRDIVLGLLRAVPIVSTAQIAKYFAERGSPEKRASEMLRSLEDEGLLEGRRRDSVGGQTKVWRLTKKGRDQFGVIWRPVPLTSKNIEHVLAIGDVYQYLRRSGDLTHFEYEPREEFFPGGKRKVYAPDAFIGWRGRALLLEMQTSRSPLSSNRWAAKWAIANEFFDEKHFERASWQRHKQEKFIKPRIIVITQQLPETVQCGSRLPLIIFKNISELGETV